MSTLQEDLGPLTTTPKQNEENIQEWLEYYKKQKVVKTFSVENTEFEKICQKSGVANFKAIAFVVIMPLSYLDLKDFLNGDYRNSCYMVFMKNGSVIADKRMFIDDCKNFKDAYNKISARLLPSSVGKIVLHPPLNNMLPDDVENELRKKAEVFEEILNLWIDKFNKLPAVISAQKYDGESPDRLLEIQLYTNYPTDNFDDVCLCLNDTVEFPDWDEEGLSSDVYDKWYESLPKKMTWKYLYDEVAKLSKTYVNLPQA